MRGGDHHSTFTPSQLADFITEQLPAPRAAWFLGCVLQLADAEDGARFWWQYAAGAGDDAAAYCLYLHHLALGDNHAAALWLEQTSLETQHYTDTTNPAADDTPDVDASIPTVLRILSHLTSAADRKLQLPPEWIQILTISASGSSSLSVTF
ncbi:hypothetical protein G4H13_05425, partial [Streptomyces rapamycinicus]|nr:hypothetical protein [Streptomyces rhizosphaericus]